MSGRTDAVDKALFLMQFHVPCWAIAEVCGRDPMSWYRFEQGLGRFSPESPLLLTYPLPICYDSCLGLITTIDRTP